MSLTIKKISKAQLAEYVDIAYRGDEELLKRYHTAQHESVESAVFSTMILIHDMSEAKELSYYKVCWNKEPIGYFVTFENVLYSFGIAIKKRKKEILEAWWSYVKFVLGKKFFSVLYDNNTRAISFLEKCGMKVVEHNLENHSILLSCQ